MIPFYFVVFIYYSSIPIYKYLLGDIFRLLVYNLFYPGFVQSSSFRNNTVIVSYENLLPMIRFDFNDRIHHIKNNLLHYHLNLDGIDLALLVFYILSFLCNLAWWKTLRPQIIIEKIQQIMR